MRREEKMGREERKRVDIKKEKKKTNGERQTNDLIT